MRLIGLLLLSLFALSCGKEQGATSLEVTLAALSSNTTGEIFLIAKNQTTGVIRREKLISDPQTLEIPNGVWEFHVIFFDGGITGTPKCGMDVQTLNGTQVNLSITVNSSNCLSTPYATATFINSGIQTLTVHSCDSIPGTLGSNCSSTPGVTQSYKIVIPNITFSSPGSPQAIADSGHVTTCYNTYASAGSNTNIRMPSGTTAMPFPFAIRAYTAPNCAGSTQDIAFPLGLLGPQTLTTGAYDDTGSTPHKAWAYFKHDTNAVMKLAANSFSIPAEASYPLDISKFITGGASPFSYSCTSCGGGSIAGSIFTNDGTTGSRAILITDSTGRYLALSMTAVTGISKDFTGLTDTPFTNARSSSAITQTGTTGVLNTVGNSTNRYARYSSAKDPGLLIEPQRQNIVSNQGNLTSWTPINSASTSYTGTSPLSANNSTIVSDGNGGAQSYIVSTYSSLTGDRVASIYAKAGTSNYMGFYFAHSGNTCNDIVVDLTNGAFINGPSCGAGEEKGVRALGGGWYHIWLKKNFSSSGTGVVYIYPAWGSFTTSGLFSATGNMSAWGAQIEQGNYVTSIINTTGSPVTRIYDNVSDSSSLVLNSASAGTVLMKWTDLSAGVQAAFTFMNSRNTGAGGTASFQFIRDSNNKLHMQLIGTTTTNLISTATLASASNPNTVVGSYNSTTMNLALNSSSNIYTSPVTSTMTAAPNIIELGNSNSGLIVHKLHKWDAYFIPHVTQQLLPP